MQVPERPSTTCTPATLAWMTDLLAPLELAPEDSGLFLDFDGTLSEIVHIPSEARPIEGTLELLSELSGTLKLVAIVSGRSATQLHEWLGPGIEIWGTHGAERIVDGHAVLSDLALPHRELMESVIEEAAEKMEALDLPGTILEDKRVMIGLHFRAADDLLAAERELDRLAQELADRHGLIRAGGRLAYELRPPVEFSKAAVVLERARAEELRSVVFIGDDRVDLPGFDALDRLAEEGAHTVRVAVNSSEAPPELLERADVVVEGPSGVLSLLRPLLAIGRKDGGRPR